MATNILLLFYANASKSHSKNLFRDSVDNVEEVSLERSTTDQTTINIRLLKQGFGIGTFHGSSVLDTNCLGDLLRNILLDPLANVSMRFLGHFWGGR